MIVKLVIQIVIVLDCAPLGSAGKGPLVEMVKDDGACACRQDATGKVRLVSWLKKVKRLVLGGGHQLLIFIKVI